MGVREPQSQWGPQREMSVSLKPPTQPGTALPFLCSCTCRPSPSTKRLRAQLGEQGWTSEIHRHCAGQNLDLREAAVLVGGCPAWGQGRGLWIPTVLTLTIVLGSGMVTGSRSVQEEGSLTTSQRTRHIPRGQHLFPHPPLSPQVSYRPLVDGESHQLRGPAGIRTQGPTWASRGPREEAGTPVPTLLR